MAVQESGDQTHPERENLLLGGFNRKNGFAKSRKLGRSNLRTSRFGWGGLSSTSAGISP